MYHPLNRPSKLGLGLRPTNVCIPRASLSRPDSIPPEHLHISHPPDPNLPTALVFPDPSRPAGYPALRGSPVYGLLSRV
eukprot:3079028-Rhodomonas_salina.2